MIIRKLEEQFYEENTHLREVLDKQQGVWTEGKTRGYGIVLIELNGLRFGIPLRSNIRHKASFVTAEYGTNKKGLDFSKAVLLNKDEYISEVSFNIPSDELKKIRDKSYFIRNKFSKYVDKYVEAVKKEDRRVLSLPQYRFTTLINYHNELELDGF